MADIRTEIHSLRQETEQTDSELFNLYVELGRAGCKYCRPFFSETGNSLYNEINTLETTKKRLDDGIKEIKDVLEQKSEGMKRIKFAKQSLKELNEEFEKMLSSLGAAAVEIYNSGASGQTDPVFSASMEKYAGKISELEQKSGQAEKISFFRSRKIRSYQSGLTDLYVQIGSCFFQGENQAVIPGEQAGKIYLELECTDSKKESCIQRLNELQEAFQQAKQAVQELGGAGDALKILRGRESEKNKTEKELRKKYSEYGTMLANSSDIQSDESFTIYLKPLCEKIRQLKIRRERQGLNMDYLEDERKLEINEAQLEILENQIRLLYRQKEAVDRQIDDFNIRIDKMQETIRKLREHQTQVSESAVLLVDKD